jgi:hypothetical protein
MAIRLTDAYRDIRKFSPAQVVDSLRDARTTQAVIGRRAHVSQSFVSRVIRGHAVLRPSKGSERVWKEIERAITGNGKGATT